MIMNGSTVEKHLSMGDTLDGLGKELKEEEDALLKVKELVLKEIRVLKVFRSQLCPTHLSHAIFL